ncbi:MAG: PAS domain S-box protein [Thermodesulfobacteriota bacterium]
MDDKKKTKAQLLDELAALHRQVRKQEKLRKAIKESEEKYRNILERIDEGYYEVDLTGKYTFINPAVEKFHGRSADELIGTSFRDYTTPETANRTFQIFDEIYQTGLSAKLFDYQIISKAGKIRELEISASLIQDADGNPIGFRGITRDVTERKKMEAEQERYREFFENATDGCYELNLRGTIIFANQAGCRIIGYSLEEFKGMDYRNYTSPETAKKIFAIYNEIYRTDWPAGREI